MAAVYKGYQASVDREVAIKVLPRQLAAEAEFVKRFENEAKAIAKLQHPHILPVLDYGTSEQGYTYIVMPFYQAGTVSKLLQGDPLPLPQIRRIITQLGDALDYAHEQGIIHRDVKPSNVLLDERGNCLLTDFGVARFVEGTAHFTATGDVMGTPSYMSPEQAMGRHVDLRSDIYSLGVMLYEMATGQAPFRAETPMAVLMKHVHDPLPSARQLNPELPVPVERIIQQALAKEPERRYERARDLVRALMRAIPEPELRNDDLDKTLPDVQGILQAVDDRVKRATLSETWSPRRKRGEVNRRPPRVLLGLPIVALIVLLAVFALLGREGSLDAATGLLQDQWERRPILLFAASPTAQVPAGSPTVASEEERTPTPERGEPSATAVSPGFDPMAYPVITPANAMALTKLLEQQLFPGVGETFAGAQFSTRSLMVAAAGYSGDVVVERLTTEDLDHRFRPSLDPNAVGLSPDESYVGVGLHDGTVRIWDLEDSELAIELPGHENNIWVVEWAPDGEQLATADDVGRLHLWRGGNWDLAGSYPQAPIASLAWSPDSTRLGLGMFNQTVRLLNTQGLPLKTFEGHLGNVTGLSWSPDGQRLASVDSAGLVRIWSTPADPPWELDAGFRASVDGLGAVAWSPDGRLLAIGDWDFAGSRDHDQLGVRVWDLGDEEEIAQLSGHSGPRILDLAWLADGRILASIDDTGHVILWGAKKRSADR